MVDGKLLRVESGKELAAKEHIEHKGSTPPSAGCGRKVGGGGKRRGGRRPDPGLTGEQMGKWTGFSRVFPDDSMQVVDFPHLMKVSQAELGTNLEKLKTNHTDTEGAKRESEVKMGREWSRGRIYA